MPNKVPFPDVRSGANDQLNAQKTDVFAAKKSDLCNRLVKKLLGLIRTAIDNKRLANKRLVNQQ